MKPSITINRTLDNRGLSKYLSTQLNNFFPDNNPVDSSELLDYINKAEERIFHCYSNIPKKYFNENGVTHFNHLQSDQYCMYIYMLANFIHKYDGSIDIPTKLYYLNKALHSADIYFTTNLPDIFLLVHPLGTIIGRAKFSDYFIAYQGCTVGCLNEGIFPIFNGKTIMYSNSSVLGNSVIGDNICLAAGASVVNSKIEDNKIVFGNHPKNKLVANSKNIFKRPPFVYGNL